MVQRFKALLNHSLGRGVRRVRLTVGLPAELSFSDSTAETDQSGVWSEAEVMEILRLVLPGQSLEQANLLTGSLNVGPLGIVKLRASKQPLRLDVYTVAGEAMLARDTSVGHLPPLEPMASVTPGSMSANSLPPLPPVASTPQVSAAPLPPVPLSVLPSVPASPNTVSAPPMVQSVSQKSAAAEADDSMFRTTPQSRVKHSAASSGPASTNQVASDLTQGFLPPIAPAMMIPAPLIPQPPVEERTDIDFGSQEKSEGSYSDGNNPIDNLLREMVQLKASDMHLTVGQPVIFRVHGEITRTGAEPITSSMMEALVLPTMPPRNRKEFIKGSDTDLAYELGGVGRFRVNVFRDRNGVGAVLRHIPSQILTAEQLGLPAAITKLCTLNKGLVLVTGPTGSGKSTTLAAMLDLINKTRKEHILTIEDPIEFVHPQQRCLVNQREVHKHTSSFARALKAALREDPDIVLIGEMRDLETIAIAIETAETGHLVFGTLHTTTAMSTVDRIIDQFPADRQAQIRTMLASSLRGVVAQTLLKKKGGGRVAAHEILISNDAVAAMIREGKIQHLANHMMTQKADGNQLLNDALFKLIQDGLVDPQDAYFKSVDKNAFLASARTKGINIAA
jgi:twitching motility protein PilT